MTHLRNWFWSWEWGPEPNRYLAALWPTLDAGQKSDLLSAILAGPAPSHEPQPDDVIERRMYGMLSVIQRVAVDPEELDLAKLRFDDLREKFGQTPDWQVEGFVAWHSSLRESRAVEEELNEDELVGVVRDARKSGFSFDQGSDAIRFYVTTHPAEVAQLIDRLFAEGLLTDEVLATVFYAASELPAADWPDASILAKAAGRLPASDRPAVAYAVADLIRVLAKSDSKDERTFWALLDLGCSTGARTAFDLKEGAYQEAINHPLGRVAEALFDHLSTLQLKRDTSLPDEAKEALDNMLQECPGRGAAISVVATRIAYLHAVDPSLAGSLMWMFDWGTPSARVAWSSFLFHPRWQRSLFILLRSDFKKAVAQSQCLDAESQRTIGRLVAQVSAFDGLLEAADTAELLRGVAVLVLEGVADQVADRVKLTDRELRDGLWRETLEPWFDACWPHREGTEEISESLARLCAYLDEAFADAVVKLRSSIGPVEHPLLALLALREEGHGGKPTQELAILLELLARNGIGYLDKHWLELLLPLEDRYPDLPETKKLQEHRLRASAV